MNKYLWNLHDGHRLSFNYISLITNFKVLRDMTEESFGMSKYDYSLFYLSILNLKSRFIRPYSNAKIFTNTMQINSMLHF